MAVLGTKKPYSIIGTADSLKAQAADGPNCPPHPSGLSESSHGYLEEASGVVTANSVGVCGVSTGRVTVGDGGRTFEVSFDVVLGRQPER